MNRLLLAMGLMLFWLSSAIADEQRKTIPLDQLWAYEMPGTRDIAELLKSPKDRLLDDILMAQFKRADQMSFKNVARPGFAAVGNGRAALEAAHAVFANNAKPKDVFSAKDEITIVFFSEPASGNHVRIKQVTRKDNQLEIQYHLEPFVESHLSEDFALIPLGELRAAKYHVEMKQLPLDPKFSKWGRKSMDEKWSNNVVCKAFSFEVVEKLDEKRVAP